METHPWFVVSASETFFFIPLTTKVFTKEQGKPGATFPQGKAEPEVATQLSNGFTFSVEKVSNVSFLWFGAQPAV